VQKLTGFGKDKYNLTKDSRAICFILFPSIIVVAFPSTALLALKLAQFRRETSEINASSLRINLCPQNTDPVIMYGFLQTDALLLQPMAR
jgi:hypothetical protein